MILVQNSLRSIILVHNSIRSSIVVQNNVMLYSWVLFFWEFFWQMKESLEILSDSYQCVLSSQESKLECCGLLVLGSKGE